MQVYATIEETRTWRSQATGTLGLVPTMGALHEGHLALVRQARRENDHVAVSIFVNPRQFGPSEDFETYPRTVERDLDLLRAESVDAVFLPGVDEMYSPGAVTEIHLPGIGDRLEGAARPGHFSGVAVVVAKLFNIVEPARAYFGRKDAQQVVVIRKMVDDLNVPVEIVPVETVRHTDGLAISSRNAYLSTDEREAAGRIAPALFAARDVWMSGECSADRLLGIVTEEIRREPLLELEYVSLADAETLEEIETVDRPVVLSIAVRCGSTRLIDSLWLGADAV